MIWMLLLLGVVGLAWFLLQPRRLQTLENVPQVVDENFRAHGIVETTEDPREVTPMADKARKYISDKPVPGHGDSLTRDWPNDGQEPHATGQEREGPLNPQ